MKKYIFKGLGIIFIALILIFMAKERKTETETPALPSVTKEEKTSQKKGKKPEIQHTKEEKTDYFSDSKAKLMTENDAEMIKNRALTEFYKDFDFVKMEQTISEESKKFNSADSQAWADILSPLQADAVLLANMYDEDAPYLSRDELINYMNEIQTKEMFNIFPAVITQDSLVLIAEDENSIVPKIEAPVTVNEDKSYSYSSNGGDYTVKIDTDFKNKKIKGIYPTENCKNTFIKVKDYRKFYDGVK